MFQLTLIRDHRLPHTTAPHQAAPSMEAAHRAFASGDVAAAEQICAQVLASMPDNGKAWALLTETALQRGRTDAAIVCADRAVALGPKDPIAHILRAKCLFVTGDAVQAFEAAETASRIVGHAPEACDALGAIFGLLGLHQRAADLFHRAVAERPHVPQYLFNLAATERMTGLLQDAEAHCDAAIAQDRRYSRAHYLRADLRTQTSERNHIDEMESVIREGNLRWSDEVMLRFALAKECEDLDLNARAFDHVEAGCNLHRRSITYNSAAEIAEIDRIIQTQTRAGLASCKSGYAGCRAGIRPWTAAHWYDPCGADHRKPRSYDFCRRNRRIRCRGSPRSPGGLGQPRSDNHRQKLHRGDHSVPRSSGPSFRRQNVEQLSLLRRHPRCLAASQDHPRPPASPGYMLGDL